MKPPVIVIHGLKNRNKPKFMRLVERFNSDISSAHEFLPVYWGDLGAQEASVRDALPFVEVDKIDRVSNSVTGNDPAQALLTTSRFGSKARHAQIADAILQSAMQTIDVAHGDTTALGGPVARVGKRKTNDTTQKAVRSAILEELPHTRFLQNLDAPEALERIGSLLGQAVQQEYVSTSATNEAASADSPIQRASIHPSTVVATASKTAAKIKADLVKRVEQLKEFGKQRIRDLDALAGSLMNAALGEVNRILRHEALPHVAQFFGDAFVYQRNQRKIQQRIWAALRDYERRTQTLGWGTQKWPVSVLAHSMGGVVAFDAAVSGDPQLWIDRFVTFGSQPAFFHIIDPRNNPDGEAQSGLLNYRPGHPVVLPASIGQWTSFWEPMDILAFATKQIFLLSDGETAPSDVVVRVIQASELVGSEFWTHSCYWTHPDVINQIHTILTA